jgi:predicted nucleic acid-binding protein
LAYLDSSAFVKLVVTEPESAALRHRLERWPDRASATLLRTETVRALRRSGHEHLVPRARQLLKSVHQVRVDEALLDRAADLEPPDLRSLDAIHLAAALSLSTDLGVVFAYDARLLEAAALLGLEADSPT